MPRGASASALLLVLLAAPGWAGSAEEPELVDPSGDQEVESGPLVLPIQEDAFDDIDIVAAWVQARAGPDAGPGIVVQTAAPPQAGATFAVTFRHDRGPTSFWHSTADGSQRTVEVTVTDSPTDPTIGVATDLYVAGAVGGDLVTIVSVTSTRTDPGTDDLPLTEDDQSGSDEAGPGAAFTLPRDPVAAGLVLQVLGEPTWDAGTGEMVLPDGGPVDLTLRITNEGTDLDTFTAAMSHGNLSASRWELVPGASQEFIWSLPGAEDELQANLTVTSDRGASQTIALRQPAAAADRTPVPANLSPLTPAALALGFDHVFGDAAELALLAVAVLLAVLVLFLATTLKRRPERGLEPPVPTAPAGSEALHAATRDLRRDAEPRGGHGLGAAGGTQAAGPEWRHEARRGSRHDSQHETHETRQETVRRLPEPERAARAGLGSRLEAIRRSVDTLSADPRTRRVVVRLDDVQHAPPDPRPGDRVRTTARIQNGGDQVARLRVVLQVDGRDVKEETITLGPGATRPIDLSWVSRHGGGDVRLQVFEAA